MRTVAVLVTWLATRGLLAWLLLGPQAWVTGDVAYFVESLDQLAARGLAATLVEYPLPAVVVVAVPWAAATTLGLHGHHAEVVMAFAAATDLAFLGLLARVRRPAPTVLWLLGVPLLGATALARFDLLPGVLCGAALLLAGRRPGLAVAAATTGAAVKLWPALLLPPIVAGARDRRRLVAGVLTAVVVVVPMAASVAGWSRVLSPLTYQVDRGLQVESVAATPAMVGSWRDPERWPVGYAGSRSYEVTGPGVEALLAVSTLASLGYGAALLWAWWRLWRLGAATSQRTLAWMALAAVTGFLVVGKVLSPQYLLWLLPVATAALAVAPSRRLLWWCAGLLVAAGLTQLVFPVLYEHLVLGGEHHGAAVGVLAARNVLLVALLAEAARQANRSLCDDEREAGRGGSGPRAQRGSALDRQAPGPDRSVGRTAR